MADSNRFWPLRWRLFWIWMAAACAVGITTCFLPLLETMGYESSLLAALVGSLGAGHLAACLPARTRTQLAPFPGARRPSIRLYVRTSALGLALLLPMIAASALNTLRVPPCNVVEGIGFFALLPIPAVLLACAVGMLAGLATPGWKSAGIAWAFLWLGGVGLALISFHQSPVVFSFGPFHGWFPGVLYDELVEIPSSLLTYRAATLLQVALALASAELLIDPASLRLSLARAAARRAQLPLWGLLALSVVAMHSAGPSLGHRTGRADLEALLPLTSNAPGLELRFPAATHRDYVKALTADAAFSLHQVERMLDAPPGEPITVFFFADADQKASAMGAAHTNVAKPWRREVYVLLDGAPHPVLRHELAHVVAARFSGGPFEVPGSFGGLVPNPGLVEGLATAAQGPRGDLTLHQWAAAMKREGLLPDTRRLFGLGFLGLNAATAYAAAGSFSLFIIETHGAAALRAVYSGASWEQATGNGLQRLTDGWHEFLDGVALDDPDLAAARHRFDRPSVIGGTCVHEVARLSRRAAFEEAAGMTSRALETLQEAHERSQGATQTRFALFLARVRAGRAEEVRAEAARLLEDEGIGLVRRDMVREILADLDVADEPAAAARTYRQLAALAPREDARRSLEVKAHLAGLPPEIAGPLLAALGRQRTASAPSEQLFLLSLARAARDRPDDPVLSYLLARQHCRHGDHRECHSLLAALPLEHEALSASITLEARMLRGRALLELRREAEAAALFDRLTADPSVRPGARELAADWAARARFAIKRGSGVR